jgi:hypothetical protein
MSQVFRAGAVLVVVSVASLGAAIQQQAHIAAPLRALKPKVAEPATPLPLSGGQLATADWRVKICIGDWRVQIDGLMTGD